MNKQMKFFPNDLYGLSFYVQSVSSTLKSDSQFKTDKMRNITQELLETRFTRIQEVTIGFLMLFFAIVGKQGKLNTYVLILITFISMYVSRFRIF